MKEHSAERLPSEGWNTQLVGFGIDYVTATFKERAGFEAFDEWLHGVPAEEIVAARVRQFHGVRRGSVFAGRYNINGEFALGMAQASGVRAEEVASVLKHLQPDGVSRLDLQATISGVDIDLEGMYSRLAQRGKNVSVIRNSAGGETLYIGSRKSSRFVRIYRKTSRRDGYEGVRFEVEFKKPLAKEAWLRLFTHGVTGVILLAEMARINDEGLAPFVEALRDFARSGEYATVRPPKIPAMRPRDYWDNVAKPWLIRVLQAGHEDRDIDAIVASAVAIIENTGHGEQLALWAERKIEEGGSLC